MGYIKAHIASGNGVARAGGFYTHGVSAVVASANSPESKTDIILDEQHVGQYAEYVIRRKVVVNLPVDKVNILLEHLEIEGGVLDLLQHTRTDDPKSVETPVSHRTGQGRNLTIDFNDLAEAGSPRKRLLLNPPPPPPPPPAPVKPKPFRPFGGLS